MNDRTHIAAMVLASGWSPSREWESRITYAVAQADALLEELAKTAKPEAEDMPLDIAAIRSGTVGLPTKASGVVHRDYYEAWKARAESAEARVAELEAALQTARAEGAKEERERIIDVLDKTDYGMVVGWRGFKREELTQLLEPKP